MGARPDGILHYRSVERAVQNYQSDRAYPPYFSAFNIVETRYDPRGAAEHRDFSFLYPRGGPGPSRSAVVNGESAFLVQGGRAVSVPAFFPSLEAVRLLNPWAVLEDWSANPDAVEVKEECFYRDDWRLVVEKPGPYGRDRLFLDRESGFPVKLERTVPDRTWGQRVDEWLWSTWIQAGSGYFPSASFELVDGATELERTVGDIDVVSRDSVTLVELPDASAEAGVPAAGAAGQAPSPLDQAPDTVRVDANTIVLSHPAYNEAVVAVGDTVYLLDATMSEARARQDSAWIARVFPRAKAVRLVVTDLAWPHVGGVRFWVARGAGVVSHAMSEDFLRELVDRRWTLRPDALENVRATASLDFTPVGPGGLTLAGGAVRVVPIDGMGSEGAVMVWVPGADFLWAGDYVQMLTGPTLYAAEVVQAARREGFEPGRVAAQHLPLTPWDTVNVLNGG